MSNLKIIDASPSGTATYEFLICEKYGSLSGVMHGGAGGVIFNMCMTFVLGPVGKLGSWDFLDSVTRILNLSYLITVPVGTTVQIHAEVIQFGKTMAIIRGIMTSQDGRTVYCTCEHHIVYVPTKKEQSEYKVERDEVRVKDTDTDAKSKL